jgi:hypothetical protein
MITLKQIKEYRDLNNVVCWHCRKRIPENLNGYTIDILYRNSYEPALDKPVSFIISFHPSCFKQVAGSEYIVETSKMF